MDPTEFIFITIWAIIALFMLRTLLVAVVGAERMGVKRKGLHHQPKDDAQVKALQGQVDTLTERVKVLEKITVEEGNSLAAEIERLRDPVALGYGGADEQLADPDRSRRRV